jgi:hypothetical protein
LAVNDSAVGSRSVSLKKLLDLSAAGKDFSLHEASLEVAEEFHSDWRGLGGS